MIDYKSINNSTLKDLKKLLFDRNKTSYEYTQWKYGPTSPSGKRGTIAYFRDKPVGCFGLVPYSFKINSKIISVGWFADWYVVLDFRGEGIGEKLLQTITESGYSLYFGHPQPYGANKLCIENGWKPIPFQSKRRLLINPLHYYAQYHKSIKEILFSSAIYFGKTIFKKNSEYFESPSSEFVHDSFFFDWVLSQPVNPNVKRIYQVWSKYGTEVTFFIDKFANSINRVRVLSVRSNAPNRKIFKIFVDDLTLLKVDAIEIFTTDPNVDKILSTLNFIAMTEAPILFFDKSDIKVFTPDIQGLDRENWHFLAGVL